MFANAAETLSDTQSMQSTPPASPMFVEMNGAVDPRAAAFVSKTTGAGRRAPSSSSSSSSSSKPRWWTPASAPTCTAHPRAGSRSRPPFVRCRNEAVYGECSYKQKGPGGCSFLHSGDVVGSRAVYRSFVTYKTIYCVADAVDACEFGKYKCRFRHRGEIVLPGWVTTTFTPRSDNEDVDDGESAESTDDGGSPSGSNSAEIPDLYVADDWLHRLGDPSNVASRRLPVFAELAPIN